MCDGKAVIYILHLFQEKITGIILVQSGSDIKHDGISLTMEGTVNLQLSAKNVGVFEAFYNSVKVCVASVLIKTCFKQFFLLLRMKGKVVFRVNGIVLR